MMNIKANAGFLAGGKLMSWAALALLCGVSLCIHILAGLEFFADDKGKAIGVTIAIACFITEIVCAYRGRRAWRSGHYFRSIILWAACIGALLQTVVFEASYFSNQFNIVAAGRSKEVRVEKSIDGEAGRLERERADLGEFLPAATLRSDLAAKRLDQRFKASESCAAPDKWTRSFCQEISHLEGRIAKADRVAVIDARLEHLRGRQWDTKVFAIEANAAAEWVATAYFMKPRAQLTAEQKNFGEDLLLMFRTGLIIALVVLGHYIFLSDVVTPTLAVMKKDVKTRREMDALAQDWSGASVPSIPAAANDMASPGPTAPAPAVSEAPAEVTPPPVKKVDTDDDAEGGSGATGGGSGGSGGKVTPIRGRVAATRMTAEVKYGILFDGFRAELMQMIVTRRPALQCYMAFCETCRAAGEEPPSQAAFMRLCRMEQGIKFTKANGVVNLEPKPKSRSSNVVQMPLGKGAVTAVAV